MFNSCVFCHFNWLLQHRTALSSFRYLSGRVFVVALMPGSQAHVDQFISPGDIIDEINGTSLRNSKNGHVRNIQTFSRLGLIWVI